MRVLTYTFEIRSIAEKELDFDFGIGVYVLALSASATGDAESEAIVFGAPLNEESLGSIETHYDVTIEPGAKSVDMALKSCKLDGRRIYISFTPLAAALWNDDPDVILELQKEVTKDQIDIFRAGIQRILRFCTDSERPSLMV